LFPISLFCSLFHAFCLLNYCFCLLLSATAFCWFHLLPPLLRTCDRSLPLSRTRIPRSCPLSGYDVPRINIKFSVRFDLQGRGILNRHQVNHISCCLRTQELNTSRSWFPPRGSFRKSGIPAVSMLRRPSAFLRSGASDTIQTEFLSSEGRTRQSPPGDPEPIGQVIQNFFPFRLACEGEQ